MKLPFVTRKYHDAEVARLSRLVERSLSPELMSMTMHQGMLDMGFKGGAAQMLAGLFCELLRDHPGAANYLSMDFGTPDLGPVNVMVQRVQGKRPIDKLREAEDLLREVKGFLRTDAYDSHKRMARKIDAMLDPA